MSSFISIGAGMGHRGPRVCRFSFQPNTTAADFTDWHSINRRGKMNHLVQPLVGLKTSRLLAFRGRWLLFHKNKVDYWTKGQLECRTDLGNLFLKEGHRNSQIADKTLSFLIILRENHLDCD